MEPGSPVPTFLRLWLKETELPTEPRQKYKTKQMVPDTRTATKESTGLSEVKRPESNALAIPLSGDLLQLDETVKSMMETSQQKFKNGNQQWQGKQCKVCGKEGRATDIMRHIEANHLEGVAIPCNHCDKMFRSKHGLNQHVSKYHKQH